MLIAAMIDIETNIKNMNKNTIRKSTKNTTASVMLLVGFRMDFVRLFGRETALSPDCCHTERHHSQLEKGSNSVIQCSSVDLKKHYRCDLLLVHKLV
jgi:hypothetical protein